MRRREIDFRYDDLAQALRVSGDPGSPWLKLFERVREGFRAARDSLVESEGRVRVIRHNVPPTAPATAAALPAAGAAYLGQIVHLDLNAVVDDTVWICIKTAGGAYAWRQVV